MFTKFATSTLAAAIMMAALAPAKAATGAPKQVDAIAKLIMASAKTGEFRRKADPKPYAFKPTQKPHHRLVRRAAASKYGTDCQWAAYQQCRDQKARGKNVVCQQPQ